MTVQQAIVLAAAALIVMFPLLYHIMSTAVEGSVSKRASALFSAGISISFASLLVATWTPKVLRLNTARITADLLLFLVIFGAYCTIVVALVVATALQKRQNEPIP